MVLGLCSHCQTIQDEVCPLDASIRQHILTANDSMTRAALRVLAMAYRLEHDRPAEIDSQALEKDLIFAGLVGMIDPPRPEVRPALDKARLAGIRTLMITGDYPNTARAIAESDWPAAPGRKVLTGAEINHLDDASLQAAVKRRMSLHASAPSIRCASWMPCRATTKWSP